MIDASPPRVLRVLAGLSGFLAVALGAFGAHALRPGLTAAGMAETWSTGSLYHLVHSVVLLCIAFAMPRARLAFWLMLVGIGLFCGSLYLFALTGIKPLAMAAPVGGASLMAGWLALAFAR